MKTILKGIYILIIAITIVSCKEDSESNVTSKEVTAKLQEYESLTDQAMEVHDEVMPKMGVLMEYSDKMQEKVSDSIATNQFLKAKLDLDGAHDGMMEWMRDYSEKFPYGDPVPETLDELVEKIAMLQVEVDEIKSLKQKTNEAIERSKELLDSSK